MDYFISYSDCSCEIMLKSKYRKYLREIKYIYIVQETPTSHDFNLIIIHSDIANYIALRR